MKKLLMATMTVMSVLSINSFAQTAPGSATLSYADFVDSCKNPGNYGQQRPPEKISVSCKNVQTVWEPIEAGSTTVKESRNLSTELFSDKYHVMLENFVIAVPELTVACPRLREVTQTSQIEKSLTCDQVIAETRDLKTICFDAINEAIAANPDLVVVVPTGKTYSPCTPVVIQK
jgi:hypothetical protein